MDPSVVLEQLTTHRDLAELLHHVRLANRTQRVVAPLVDQQTTTTGTGLDERPDADLDARAAFLEAMRRYPLLPASDAEGLSRAIRADDDDRGFKLGSKVLRGVEARNELVIHNLKLAVQIVLKNRYRTRETFGDVDDLTQVAFEGLIRATEKFNPDLGFAFSTYATWWIKQAVTREPNNTRSALRIPVHAEETLARIRRKAQKHNIDLSRVTIGELSQLTDSDPIEIQKLLRAAMAPLSWEAMSYAEICPSFDDENWEESVYHEVAHECDGSWTSTHDEVSHADPLDDSIEELVQRLHLSFLTKQILNTMAPLPERQQRIIKLRFGLSDGVPRTLEEVGNEFNLTRERIRQLQTKTIQAVRAALAPTYPSLRPLLTEDDS